MLAQPVAAPVIFTVFYREVGKSPDGEIAD